MSAKLLNEHNLEFQSLKGGCTGSSESTLVKCQIVGNHMPRLICEDDNHRYNLGIKGQGIKCILLSRLAQLAQTPLNNF